MPPTFPDSGNSQNIIPPAILPTDPCQEKCAKNMSNCHIPADLKKKCAESFPNWEMLETLNLALFFLDTVDTVLSQNSDNDRS